MPEKITTEELEATFGRPFQQWQREFILDESPQIVLKMGRKCGKTYACAAKIARDALSEDFSFTDGVLILSRGQRQAANVFDTVKGLLAKLGIKFSQWPDQEAGEAYASRTKIVLPSGNTIYCLPSGNSGDTLRTYSFWKIYFDEAAFIGEDVFTATDACLAVYGRQAVYASTPMLSTGKFYDVWHEPSSKRYELMTAQAGLVRPEFLAKKRLTMTRLNFQREYEGKFIESAEGLFSRKLIAGCTHREAVDKKELFAHKTFVGVDFARFGESENVIAFAHMKDGQAWCWIEIVRGKMRTTHVTGRLMWLVREYPTIRKIICDDHGVGAGPTDALIEALGPRKVMGMSNQRRLLPNSEEKQQGFRTSYIKADLYSNLIRLMEYGKIKLVPDANSNTLVRSLLSMWYDYSSSGDLLVKGSYSHGAEALVRAVFPVGPAVRRLSVPHLESIPYPVGGGLHLRGLVGKTPDVYGLEGEKGWKTI